ncbi:MAG: Glucosidase YgjK [Syntrophomonadaceae bacterium]|nr:Glucosidase YgjK [Bacillota bacterium]MBT9148399.1 Glucosidase YgjK [Bacillota bacterium]
MLNKPLGALDGLLHKIEDPIVKKACEAICSELRTNLKKPSGNMKGRYAVPGGKYQKSWLWDAAFISQIWLLIDAEIAREIVLTHTMGQLKNGMIPHMVGPRYKSSITHPPLLAWAAWRIYEQTKDKHFISQIYPKLKLFNEWLYLTRDFGGNGLFSWVRSDESGLDDSPRFDGIKENQATGYPWIIRALGIFMDISKYVPLPRLGNLDIRSIEALDLNCYLVVQMSSLAKMAEVLRLSPDAKIFKTRVDTLIRQIRSRLWDEEDSFFYDLGPEGFIKVPTIAAFLTLFAEVATGNQAEALIKHLGDEKEFWTPFPIPTVAVNNPKFLLRGWRGPVWINTNYMVYLGLRKYGYDELAKELRDTTIRMVVDLYARRGHFFEFYSPHTGDIMDSLFPKPTKHFVGWTGLIINLLADKYSFSL